MKKYIYFILMLIGFTMTVAPVSAKPLYIVFRVGFFAKWDVVIGDCAPGRGICLSIGNPTNPDNATIGFDDAEPNVFVVKVLKESNEGKAVSIGKFELLEDSPIDPRLIQKLTNFKNPDKKIVSLKKGAYPVSSEANYYVIRFGYLMK